MTRAAAPDAGAVVLTTADVRLGPYAVLAAIGTVAALVTGEALFFALAGPALVMLAVGARRVPPVTVAIGATPERVLEGDRWTLTVELSWPNPTGRAVPLELDVLVQTPSGHRAVGDAEFRVRAVEASTVTVDVIADRWGRHGLGDVVIRAGWPGGLLRRDVVVDPEREVRVLPAASRLDALVHPVRPHAAAGVHAAQTRGPGTDFADLRPYTSGDRLRDISWSASARSEHPWVVIHHPERSGTVVLFLDGFGEPGVPQGALDRAARIVWSLARHHLANGDRVGLLATGPAVVWLSPVAGRRSRWKVLDALLDVRRLSTTPGGGRPPTLPGDAFVVGVSPLQSDAFVADVAHHRRRGRAVAVVGVETLDLLDAVGGPAAVSDVERAARRLWRLESEVRVATLARAGVRTVLVRDDATPAVRALATSTQRHVRRRIAS